MTILRRVILTAALFGLMAGSLEYLLGFFHLERYDPELGSRSSFPLFVPGEGEFVGYYQTNPHFRDAMNLQRFRRTKGEGVFRIFVLGGSAAFGWPGEDPDSFTGYLRRALDLSAPGRFEIVNAAGMSYGSHRVLDLLGDVVRFAPDLVVIYSGNNEYVERNVLPAGALRGGLASSIRDALGRTNIYRALRLAIWKTPGLRTVLDRHGAPDITDLRSNPAVVRVTRPRSPGIDEQVLRQYRENLSGMARILGKSSVRSVFFSIPVNLESWQPSEPPLRFSDRKDMLSWVSDVREAKALLGKDPARAADLLGDLLRRKPEWAPGAFFRGQALEGLGKHDAALRMFLAARDGDSRPLRALGSFNKAVEEVAAARGATFIDLDALFREKSPNGITGDALVRDYCHPTEAGHKLIAAALAPIVLRESGMERIGRSVGNAIAGDSFSRTKPPLLRASELYATGMTDYFNGRHGDAEKIFREVLKLDPEHLGAMNNLGILCMDKRRLPEARALFQRAVAIDPAHIHAHYNMGLLHLLEGNPGEAEKSMRTVLSMNPEYPGALLHLGDIAQKKGDFQGALGLYRRALATGSDYSRLHLMMGRAYLSMGDKGRAAAEFERALEFDPANDEAARLADAAR